MKCDECQLIIEAYFDGELNEETGLQVSRHIESCASCSGVLQALEADEELYANHQSEIDISPELWAGVQSRLAVERPAPRWFGFRSLPTWLSFGFNLPPVNGWVAAALVLVAISLTAVLMRYVLPHKDRVLNSISENSPQATPLPQPETAVTEQDRTAEEPRNNVNSKKETPTKRSQSTAAARNAKSPARTNETTRKTKTPDQLVREAEQKYLAAIAMLSRTVERRRSRLDAPTLAKLEQALESIDRTIAGTRKAVRQHPDDPVAVQYMLTAYARKVDVLRQMSNY